MQRFVFVTGSTGYVGRALIPALLARGHRVRALARDSSVARVPAGAEVVTGHALDEYTYQSSIAPCDTLVHLVGVPHPNPAKAQQFRDIDLRAALAAVRAAQRSNVSHVVQVSVAQPAPVMKAFQAARREAELALLATGIPATIVRPWYILGPGHRWPVALIPLYALLELLPATREGAQRLGLVSIAQMVNALVNAVENPPSTVRVVDVPGIRGTESQPARPLLVASGH